MAALVTVLIIIGIILVVGSPIVFFQARRVLREQKNYERGLKMVMLLIQLPPPSEDISIGGRDARDVDDENISKAQILYSIIASTFKKDFRNRFYGQRHFSFEIVCSKGLVNFYAAVPVALVDVVKQAVVSAYPTARLEEVSESNIFSPIGKISGTIGGEMSLKESFAYPIATFQEIKRDPMQSLLNALSSLDKDDGAGIQILIRPANPSWRKVASSIASQKRHGQSSKKAPAARSVSLLNQIIGAGASQGEGKSSDPNKDKVSNLDQSVSDAIEDKVKYPGFEVLIRVVASSNISQKSQTILRNITSSFALYDSPGKNGFKYTVAKDMERFVTAYILRFFPPENKRNILNSVELATLFHFPDRKNIPTSQLDRQESKQVDGPRNIPEQGLLLGYNLFRGVKKPVRLDLSDRQRHVYVVGQTGTGKSTFLENMALQDMLSGGGFAFVDPHGDTADRLLAMVPKERTEDVIYFSPADTDYPLGLNLFEYKTSDQKDFLIQEALNMLYKLYDPQHQGIMGPRYEHLFRMAALTVMADPAGGTFIDIPKLFRDPQFVKQKLQYVTDQNVLEFWQKEIPQSQRSNEFGEVTSWFVSKFGAFLSNEMMRNIIGQTKSAFDLREVMDQGKILLVNLSKGRTGELNSKLLGMVFVMKFQAAAMSRSNIPESNRKDFCLYVDEFQNFSTDSFATIMSEARKYHLNLVVANQFTTQLSDEIRDAVFGNIGTIIAFRVGQNDVDILAKYFQPLFEGEDLLRVPNFNTIVRTLINGVPTQSFSMTTMPALGQPNPELAQALKQLSAAKYGHPKGEVEKTIFARLATKEEPKPFSDPMAKYYNQGNAPTSPAAMPQQSPLASAAPKSSSSFLDEWLQKKQLSSSPVAPRPNPQAQARPQFQPTPTAQNPISATAPPDLPIAPAATDPFANRVSQTPVEPPMPALSQAPMPQNPLTPQNLQPLMPAENLIDDGPVPQPTKPQEVADTKDNSSTDDFKLPDNEFKIPHNEPSLSQVEDTIYIDTSGKLHDNNGNPQ